MSLFTRRGLLIFGSSFLLGLGAIALAGWRGWVIFMVAEFYGFALVVTS